MNLLHRNHANKPYWDSPWLGGILGCIFFYLIFGNHVLDPTYIVWRLAPGDEGQHFIGWEFFRNEIWHFPLGLIQNYGFPIGTSIVYLDTIPLLSLIFKLFSSWLPQNFQYMGFWFLACYFLQGFFAWLVLSQFEGDKVLKVLGTSFFILSPILLARLIAGHEALGAHWLLLAGFYLYERELKKGLLRWTILIFIAWLVHAYLAAMLLVIWAAFLAKALYIEKNISYKTCIIHIVYTVVLALLGMWLAGYFFLSTGGIKAVGFGHYSMNLIALINPGNVWWEDGSAFLKVQSVQDGQYEGFNYFGCGVLALIMLAVYEMVKKPPSQLLLRHYLPLLLGCAVLFFYAACLGQITLGNHKILSYHLSGSFWQITDIFRVSGRFFWVVYYFVMLMALRLLIRRNSSRVALIVLVCALLVQAADFSSTFKTLHEKYQDKTTQKSPLQLNAWEQIMQHYRHLVFVPAPLEIPLSFLAQHYAFAHYAATHNMTMNVGYFARKDINKLQEQQEQQMQQFLKAELNADTLYIVTDKKWFNTIKPKLSRGDKVGTIDGIYFVAPTFAKNKVDNK